MKKRKKSKKTWLWEFSKKIVFAMAILYIVERVYTMAVIYLNGYGDFDTFLRTGAEVFLATTVSYALKAGFENVSKIRKTKEAEDDEESDYTSNGRAD